MDSSRFLWLASYPRSGNTWLRMLLEACMERKLPQINRPRHSAQVANRREFDELLGVESSELTISEIEEATPAFYQALAETARASLILRKVHDRYGVAPGGVPLFPPSLTHGAVYLVRDPRDVAVSLAAFWGQSLDWTIEWMANPDAVLAGSAVRMGDQLAQRLGTWSGHVVTWLDEAPLKVHLLRYEDLLADTASSLAAVARFAGFDDAAASFAAGAADFRELRGQEDREGFSERPPTAERFFRKGKAGDWVNILSAAQRARIESEHGDAMQRLGYL